MLDIDRTVGVLGTGSAVPDRRVTNAELEGMISNYDAGSGDFSCWVDRVTHIQERRFVASEDETAGVLGLRAARKALATANLEAGDIDHLIFASFTYHDMFPGEHTWMANELGLTCGTFALAAACAGSLYGLSLARMMVGSGMCRNVLVVGSETLSRVMDMEDPVTSILFSDAAGAVVVGRTEGRGDDHGFVGKPAMHTLYQPGNITMWNANTPHAEERLPGPERNQKRAFLRMKGGPRVLRNAVNKMAESVLEVFGFTPQDLKADVPELREILDQVRLIPHQANGRIVDGLGDKLGLERDAVYRTIYRYGNSSTATNLLTLDYAMREGNLWREPPADGSKEMGKIVACGRTLQKGDLVVVTSIGAGYLYGSVAFRHGY